MASWQEQPAPLRKRGSRFRRAMRERSPPRTGLCWASLAGMATGQAKRASWDAVAQSPDGALSPDPMVMCVSGDGVVRGGQCLTFLAEC